MFFTTNVLRCRYFAGSRTGHFWFVSGMGYATGRHSQRRCGGCRLDVVNRFGVRPKKKQGHEENVSPLPRIASTIRNQPVARRLVESVVAPITAPKPYIHMYMVDRGTIGIY